jgi:hypothetical protein
MSIAQIVDRLKIIEIQGDFDDEKFSKKLLLYDEFN